MGLNFLVAMAVVLVVVGIVVGFVLGAKYGASIAGIRSASGARCRWPSPLKRPA